MTQLNDGVTQRRVVIVTFDDYTDLDVVLLWDLLNRVEAPGWSVRIIGDSDRHRSMTNLWIPVHGPLAEANEADAVLFASGRGTRAKVDDPTFLSTFRLEPKRQLIGSICSGALILAKLGFLYGHQATTYPTAAERLSNLGVDVIEKPFVRRGNIATAGGCLAGQQLAHWVIEKLVDQATADKVIVSCQPVGMGLRLDEDLSGIRV